MAPRCAVIGAGALGLMAVKNLKEEGFEVVGIESREYVGGLWKDSEDDATTVHDTTAFNTSIYRAAASDFPFPPGSNDYPTAPQFYDYLNSYADHFDLRRHIRLGTRVLAVRRVENQWELAVQTRTGSPQLELFDKLVVAVGTFITPKRPKIEGVEKFQGRVIHSSQYHGPQPFRDQNVLMIGVHASAQDVVNSLKDTARKAWMAHRRGLLMLTRYGENGGTFDQMGSLSMMKFMYFMDDYLPSLWNWILQKMFVSMSKKAFVVRPEWKLLPAPSVVVSTPLMADEFYSVLQSGFATPVSPVRAVTGPKTVELKDGTILEDVDSIIQCTGYETETPFMPKEYDPYPVYGKEPYLYRNIFPLHEDEKIRNSLVYLGHGAMPFPGLVQFDLATMAIAQIWQGRQRLPPLKGMQQWHTENLRWRQAMTRKYGESSTFYPAFLRAPDHFRWLNRTAGTGVLDHFGWFSWRAWKLWWQDKELYNQILKGLFTPTIFRLFDMGLRKPLPWAEARKRIFADEARAEKQRKDRLAHLEKQKHDGTNGHAANSHAKGD